MSRLTNVLNVQPAALSSPYLAADADDASCCPPRAMNCTDEIRDTGSSLRLLAPKATEDMSRLHQGYDRG
ncbi:hypothetical protein GUJ93_ZPchr0006g44402 [Zizania palustris]|uniref:Uncharacterized protein n=1 Tax=Zizania palustris TaxID=103762 RepID=A0A8J5VHF8_ZIZPA|nr:hypothetical protein GUJ93_ZPchr0006g44402 [Zizania palustris]